VGGLCNIRGITGVAAVEQAVVNPEPWSIHPMARLVSLLLMATLIVLLGITFYQVVPLFLAAVLAMLCQPVYRKILAWTGHRTALASGLTTAAALLLILVPALLGTIAATKQMYTLAQSTLAGREWRSATTLLRERLDFDRLAAMASQFTGEEVTPEAMQRELDERLRAAAVALAQKTLGFVGSTLTLLGNALSILVGSMIFGVALYYFLGDGPALIQGAIDLIPVHREYQQQLLTQFQQAVRAVVLATFSAALGQGIATGIGMSLTGFHHFFLVTILATVTALIPLLGTWLVWGPYVVWLACTDHWGQAAFLAIYGAAFVGLLDNVIRTYVLQSNVKLHPLLAFVSVLGGIQVMGLWGVFIGPIVASCLHALVKIFNAELVAFSHERTGKKSTAAGATAVELLPAADSGAAAANATADSAHQVKTPSPAPNVDGTPREKTPSQSDPSADNGDAVPAKPRSAEPN
jgi:predicted PurR-regulated permease PerM